MIFLVRGSFLDPSVKTSYLHFCFPRVRERRAKLEAIYFQYSIVSFELSSEPFHPLNLNSENKYAHTCSHRTLDNPRRIYPSTETRRQIHSEEKKEEHSPLLVIAAAPTNCMARTAPTRRNFPEPLRFAATDSHLTADDPFDALVATPLLTLLVRGWHRRDLPPRSSPPPPPPLSDRNTDVVPITAITRSLVRILPSIGRCTEEKQCHPAH